MKRIPISQIVIVEGRYDKITLENVIDAVIIPCDGFAVFKNEELKASLKSMARRHGAILLTDPDQAGAVIRNYLKTILQGAEVYPLYVPALDGKEKRKKTPSQEGYLGVEGTDAEILRGLFSRFEAKNPAPSVFAADLYEWGIIGKPNSSGKKASLLKKMELPPHLSTSALLKEINRRFTRESLIAFLQINE